MSNAALLDNQTRVEIEDRHTTFYVVSVKKFVFLFVATVGMYMFYWFYKNWKCYKLSAAGDRRGEEGAWPVARAFFSIFYVHRLFREISALGADKPRVAEWDNGKLATQLVITLIASQLLNKLSYRNLGAPYTDILSFVILVPMLIQLLIAQNMINIACDDPEGASNQKFTIANYVWIAVGAIFWFLIFLGILGL